MMNKIQLIHAEKLERACRKNNSICRVSKLSEQHSVETEFPTIYIKHFTSSVTLSDQITNRNSNRGDKDKEKPLKHPTHIALTSLPGKTIRSRVQRGQTKIGRSEAQTEKISDSSERSNQRLPLPPHFRLSERAFETP